MGFLQRVATTYIFLLVQVSLLVYYLDDGMKSEPLMVFMAFWTFDSLIILSLVMKCMRKYNVCGLHDSVSEEDESDENNLSSTIYNCSIFTAKLLFEIMLYVLLKTKENSILLVLVPLWSFLILAIGRLFHSVVEQHYKTS
ncbi:unnamed protein product [Bursaphelenchus okinawaensis]|uniref:Transmembrane protein 60 n=1 Tax=Bursaphelenchus okinawaensis TaxID=465554 RepID=A0A811LTT0_9BILA|nr:unnamed protein product [Bursaphelenchus okinawaensis]CAG9127925.1 unnamed protein product [Bursaphelenchus okinawaensis]